LIAIGNRQVWVTTVCMDRSAQVKALVLRVFAGPDPAARLEALRALRHEFESIETELAAEAVREGLSWRQIGDALGVSKQAAHRRHSRGAALLNKTDGRQPDAKQAEAGDVAVSVPARRAVRLARQEAARMGQSEFGTEHLLLGVLQCGDVDAVAVLARLGVTLSAARDAIEPTSEMTVESARKAYAAAAEGGTATVVSPVARRVLERALSRSATHKSKELTAVDLLSSILTQKEAGATRTLERLGVDPSRARHEVVRKSTWVSASRRP
jgi:Clp amino terminal domain, pathogenicity island component